MIPYPEANFMRKMLRENTCEVIFKKKDGSLRNMFCTLMPQFLPEAEAADKVRSETVITALDLEKNDWRSFRADSVVSMTPVQE